MILGVHAIYLNELKAPLLSCYLLNINYLIIEWFGGEQKSRSVTLVRWECALDFFNNNKDDIVAGIVRVRTEIRITRSLYTKSAWRSRVK